MVLPAVAAAGRVVVGSTRATTRPQTKKLNPLQRATIRDRRDRRIEAAREEEQLAAEAEGLRAFQNQTRLKQLIAQSPALRAAQRGEKGKQSLVRTTFRRVRAVSATMATMAFYFWFYLIQLGCGIIFIVAGYLEETWAGWFFAGDTISMLGWTICSIISLVFMFIAIVSLVTVRAKVGNGLTMLMFLTGIAGSIVPYLNLLPWPALFMAVAVANQK